MAVDSTLAWTSDWHVGRSGFSNAQVDALVSHINGLSVIAGAIDTGDSKELFDNPTQMQDYETHVRDAMNWLPLNVGFTATEPILPGNHDEMSDYLEPGPADFEDFDTILWGAPYHWTCDWDEPQIRFIGFHTRMCHKDEIPTGGSQAFHGFFITETAERTWLTSELDALPVGWKAIVCSHAPLATGFGNNIGIWAGYGGTEIRAILAARTDKIAAYFNGHRHQNMNTTVVDGIKHFNGGGTSYTAGTSGGFMPIDYDDAARTLTVRYMSARTPFAAMSGYTPIVLQLDEIAEEEEDSHNFYFRAGEPVRGLA